MSELYGNNRPLTFQGDAMHGDAVLALVVGRDNGKGGIGVAPGAGPVRVASHYVLGPPSSDLNVAGAIAACNDPVCRNIGVMPDLAKVLNRIGAVPDLYIRDDVGDDGLVPSAGAVSVSPDVVVSTTNVPASTAFTANGSTVEAGQPNFVYVRVSNRNPAAASNAKVKVYWAPPASLVTPLDWKAVAAAPVVVNVAALTTLVPAPVITWSANLPPTGHYCFIAIVDHPLDPEPLTPIDGDGSFHGFTPTVSHASRSRRTVPRGRDRPRRHRVITARLTGGDNGTSRRGANPPGSTNFLHIRGTHFPNRA
jgi:hypothetical protein